MLNVNFKMQFSMDLAYFSWLCPACSGVQEANKYTLCVWRVVVLFQSLFWRSLSIKQESSDFKMSLKYSGYIHTHGKFVKQSFSGRKTKFWSNHCLLMWSLLLFSINSKCNSKKKNSKKKKEAVWFYLLIFILALYWTSSKLLWRE